MVTTNSPLNLTDAAKNLDQHCTLWQSYLHSTESIDRKSTEFALVQLYESIGKRPPKLIWCESPWQIAAMAAVLEKGLSLAAIKKWHNHPVQLRLSENDFDLLWKKLWVQIDAQLSIDTREELVKPDEDSLRETKEKLKDSWFDKLTLGQISKTRKTWNLAPDKVRAELVRLGKEMRGGCSARLEQDPIYSNMLLNYRDRLRSYVNRSINRQLQNEFFAFGTAGLSLAVLERFQHEDIANLSLEVLKGHAKDEFDRICTPDERKAMDFALLFSVLSTRLCGVQQDQDILALIPFYDYLCDQLPGLPVGPSNRRKAKNYLNLLKQSQYVLPYDKLAFICERPVVLKLDTQGRLHSEAGPALEYTDGFQIYSWHGASVPKKIIDHPEHIGIAEIERQRNAEIRRVMIDRYGMQRFIENSGAREVHRDETGVLYRKEFLNDEPLVMVKVINSTVEPDGSFKSYFLRVPPSMTTAREAVAWTFDMSRESYELDEQT